MMAQQEKPSGNPHPSSSRMLFSPFAPLTITHGAGMPTEIKGTEERTTSVSLEELGARLRALRQPVSNVPDVSVVVPVNAQGDLKNVLQPLTDIANYSGPYTVEAVLVINNYPAESPPPELETFSALGARVVAVPNVRRTDRPGEAVCLSARIPGLHAATSEFVVLFDADCRIPNATALLNWYIKQFRNGAQAAYTPVGYYDLSRALPVRTKIAIHHLARWIKRNMLGIPTTRGSNYAVRRDAMLDLYEQGVLADDFNIGPACKAIKGRVAYSGRAHLTVYTSGRMFRAGWSRIIPYFMYRLRYNLRVLPVRDNAERYTLREKVDPAGRYVYANGEGENEKR
jgi:hypothetical protein